MKKRFKSKPPADDQMTLQITSMADVFMIVLVFLLKSFSTSMISVSPSAGNILPLAHADGIPSESLTLEISETAVQVEGKPVLHLEKYRLAGSSDPLNEALSLQRKRQKLIADQNPDVKLDSKIMIMAGQDVPYGTLKTVLASAAANGFNDFKLVVAKPE